MTARRRVGPLSVTEMGVQDTQNAESGYLEEGWERQIETQQRMGWNVIVSLHDGDV